MLPQKTSVSILSKSRTASKVRSASHNRAKNQNKTRYSFVGQINKFLSFQDHQIHEIKQKLQIKTKQKIAMKNRFQKTAPSSYIQKLKRQKQNNVKKVSSCLQLQKKKEFEVKGNRPQWKNFECYARKKYKTEDQKQIF